MRKFREWLRNLGEHSSRTDIWVFCFLFAFISCFTGWLPCNDNTIVRTLLTLMAVDLGIVKVTDAVEKVFKK